MELLCMHGVFDSAGSLRARINARRHIAFWPIDTMGFLHREISELNTQPTDTPVQRFKCSLTVALAWLGARVVRYTFPVRLFHSLLHAGLSRRCPVAFTQTRDRRTMVPLELGPRGSLFVVFRKPIPLAKNGAKPGNFSAFSQVMELQGPWTVKFDPRWGGPESVEFSELADWTKRPEEGIKYYSGKATYAKTFDLDSKAGHTIYLNLGELHNVAEVGCTARASVCSGPSPFGWRLAER
jgi:hypothetical protein